MSDFYDMDSSYEYVPSSYEEIADNGRISYIDIVFLQKIIRRKKFKYIEFTFSIYYKINVYSVWIQRFT